MKNLGKNIITVALLSSSIIFATPAMARGHHHHYYGGGRHHYSSYPSYRTPVYRSYTTNYYGARQLPPPSRSTDSTFSRTASETATATQEKSHLKSNLLSGGAGLLAGYALSKAMEDHDSHTTTTVPVERVVEQQPAEVAPVQPQQVQYQAPQQQYQPSQPQYQPMPQPVANPQALQENYQNALNNAQPNVQRQGQIALSALNQLQYAAESLQASGNLSNADLMRIQNDRNDILSVLANSVGVH